MFSFRKMAIKQHSTQATDQSFIAGDKVLLTAAVARNAKKHSVTSLLTVFSKTYSRRLCYPEYRAVNPGGTGGGLDPPKYGTKPFF